MLTGERGRRALADYGHFLADGLSRLRNPVSNQPGFSAGWLRMCWEFMHTEDPQQRLVKLASLLLPEEWQSRFVTGPEFFRAVFRELFTPIAAAVWQRQSLPPDAIDVAVAGFRLSMIELSNRMNGQSVRLFDDGPSDTQDWSSAFPSCGQDALYPLAEEPALSLYLATPFASVGYDVRRSMLAGGLLATNRDPDRATFYEALTKHLPGQAIAHAGCNLFLRVCARCSPEVFGVLCRRASAVTESMLRSFSLTGYWFTVSTDREQETEKGDVGRSLEASRALLQEVRAERLPTLARAVRAYLNEDLWSEKSGQMRQSRAMDGRIRNAVCLLVEADDEKLHAAVRLALCVSAMEALLSREGTGVADQLAERAVVLLEHRSEKREEARRRVKKLYDDRSKALHGRTMEIDPERAADARRLGAGVLVACLIRQEFVFRTTGQDEKEEQFFSELQNAKMNAAGMAGVESWFELWRTLPE